MDYSWSLSFPTTSLLVLSSHTEQRYVKFKERTRLIHSCLCTFFYTLLSLPRLLFITLSNRQKPFIFQDTLPSSFTSSGLMSLWNILNLCQVGLISSPFVPPLHLIRCSFSLFPFSPFSHLGFSRKRSCLTHSGNLRAWHMAEAWSINPYGIELNSLLELLVYFSLSSPLRRFWEVLLVQRWGKSSNSSRQIKWHLGLANWLFLSSSMRCRLWDKDRQSQLINNIQSSVFQTVDWGRWNGGRWKQKCKVGINCE